MQCPKRKEAINKKRRETKENKTITYSKITKQGSTTQVTPPPITTSIEMQAKTYSCMLFAMLMDVANPATFQEELDEIFEKNYLPKIKITKTPLQMSFLD